MAGNIGKLDHCMRGTEDQDEIEAPASRTDHWGLPTAIICLLVLAALIYLPGSPLVQSAYQPEGTCALIHGDAATWLRVGFGLLVLAVGACLFWTGRAE